MGYTLITGASSGMGEEFARQYAQKGHSLILVARSKEKLNELAAELKEKHPVIKIHVIKQDLAQLDSAEQLFAKCRELDLEVNFLINDAGVGLIGRFEEFDIKRIEEMIILNTITVTKLTYLFLPQLKKNRGSLLNVASQVAFEPAPFMAAYGATKAYVLNLTEALWVELKGSGMQIMALCPGPTYTYFFKRTDWTPSKIRFKFRTASNVVAHAIKAMDHHKHISIPGWENEMMTFMTRLTPRAILAKFSGLMVKGKH